MRSKPFSPVHFPDAGHATVGSSRLKWIGIVCLLVFVVSQTGCQIFGRFNRTTPKVPQIANSNMTLDQWLIALNEQSNKISQLKTSVRVAMDGAPTMRGNLSIEHPKRLRMKAGIAGITAIDVGSNDELFWIWTKSAVPGQPPTLMYARHLDFETSPVRRQIPIDPEWLIAGLGFTKFLPTDRHEGPSARPTDGMLELITYRQTGTEQNIRKCVIDPKTGFIAQQSFYDQNGTTSRCRGCWVKTHPPPCCSPPSLFSHPARGVKWVSSGGSRPVSIPTRSTPQHFL